MNETYGGYALVKYSQDVAAQIALSSSRSPKAAVQAAPWGTFVRRIAKSGWTLWRVPVVATWDTLVSSIKADTRVVAVQKLNKIYALSDPNDPDFNVDETSESFILNFGDEDISFKRLWHLRDANAIDAWADWPNQWYTAANKPADAPTIAIIDTGCDIEHPDFANAGSTSTDSEDGGQLDLGRSAHFTFGAEDPGGSIVDTNGHGTHVSGIAIASANNGGFDGHGVIGTGYNSKAMILRVFDDSGNGSDADAAAAIYYAADNGADIINLSLGTTNFSQLFQDAVTYAWQKGCLVVCAGNENGNGGGNLGPIYPAACSGALAVTANGPDGQSASGTYAGTGRYVDIAAPGGDIVQSSDYFILQYVFSTSCRYDCDLSTNPNVFPPYTLEYSYLIGTSMACPVVSGAAGLYYGKLHLRQHDGWSNVRAYRALERSAASVYGAAQGGWEPTQGYGCVDMWSLLQEADARGAVAGTFEGIVYYNGTPLSNVAVKAQRLGTDGNPTGVVFSTTTSADGTYRYDALPAGTFKVWAAPFGVQKTKYGLVVPGSDTTGFDFWAGTTTGDSTPPVVAKLNVNGVGPNYVDLDHWAYDTETGIDSMVFRIGSTQGAADVLPDTNYVISSHITRLDRLALQPNKQYYITATYTNGNGTSTTASTTFRSPNLNAATAAVTLQDYAGSITSVPVTIDLRSPGTTTVLETIVGYPAADGTIKFMAPSATTYDVAIKASHWLRSTSKNVAFGWSVPTITAPLINGDVNGDNQITATDNSILSTAYRSKSTSANWDPRADLNGDGQVSATDASILSRNFRKKGDS